MSERGGAVHVVTTRRNYKGRVYETHLLRRSYREGDRVKNETLGNLSHLPAPLIDLVRRALRGETFVPVAERLEVLGSRPHGHVQAVRLAMQRLGIESLIGSRASPRTGSVVRAHRRARTRPRTPSSPPPAGGTRARLPRSSG